MQFGLLTIAPAVLLASTGLTVAKPYVCFEAL
jgi:hypothetical protein